MIESTDEERLIRQRVFCQPIRVSYRTPIFYAFPGKIRRGEKRQVLQSLVGSQIFPILLKLAAAFHDGRDDIVDIVFQVPIDGMVGSRKCEADSLVVATWCLERVIVKLMMHFVYYRPFDRVATFNQIILCVKLKH